MVNQIRNLMFYEQLYYKKQMVNPIASISMHPVGTLLNRTVREAMKSIMFCDDIKLFKFNEKKKINVP